MKYPALLLTLLALAACADMPASQPTQAQRFQPDSGHTGSPNFDNEPYNPDPFGWRNLND